MSRRMMIVIAALATVGVVVLVVGLRGASQTGSAEPAVAAPTAQPSFEPFPAPPLGGKTLDGEPFALADYAGTPVVLNFWASWCAPCRREIPALQTFAEANPSVAVVGVNYQDATEPAQAFVDELGIAWPSMVDDGPAGAAFKVPGLPATFFIDADGQVVGRILGEVDASTLAQGAEALGLS